MKLLQTLSFAAAITLSSQVAVADPVTLDFNNAAARYGFGTVVEKGFNVSGTGTYFMSLGGNRYCSPACADNNSNNLLSLGATFTVSAVSGGLFSLLGFDGAESFMNHASLWATTLHVVGQQDGGATVVADFALDFINDGNGGVADFQTFMLPSNFVNLSSVVFSGIGDGNNNFALDNLQVERGATQLAQLAQANAVPEPGSLLLWAVALAGLAATRRRKSAV